MFFASGNLGGTKAIWAAPRGIQQEFDACFCYKTNGHLTFDPPWQLKTKGISMDWGGQCYETTRQNQCFFASGNLGGTQAIWSARGIWAARGVEGHRFASTICYKTNGNLTFDPPCPLKTRGISLVWGSMLRKHNENLCFLHMGIWAAPRQSGRHRGGSSKSSMHVFVIKPIEISHSTLHDH